MPLLFTSLFPSSIYVPPSPSEEGPFLLYQDIDELSEPSRALILTNSSGGRILLSEPE